MFKKILSELVDSIPGACGAVFADWEGEAVDSYSSDGDDDHVKFVGAHNGILLDSVKRLSDAANMGKTTKLMIRSETHDYITSPVHDGYYLVVAVKSGTQIARVDVALGRAIAELKQEMGY